VHARLAEGGVVVLGHAEALDRLDARFRPAASAAAFVYERVSAKPGSASATQPLFGAPAPTLPAPRRRSYPPPAPSATPAPAVQAPPAISVLSHATKLAGLGRLDEAAALCDEHLRSAGPDAAAYFLLGTIKQASGDPGAAVTCFERALYLEPAHYEALVHLALLLDQRGERSAAAQLRRRADRAQPGGSR
jgi:chemotaxis protein methyltransferase WspC